MKITWLGQSGYIFEHHDQRLIVDPYLSDIVFEKEGLKRLIDAPLTVEQLKPDCIFITHDHLDHFDPVTLPEIHRQFPGCSIAGPQSVIEHCRKLAFNESVLVPMDKGSVIRRGEFIIYATPAYHSDPFAVGIIIEAGGKTIYVSGDTMYNDNLSGEILAIAPDPIDLAFVVINGKLGNMDLQKAVELMKEIHPKQAIPMHYGMFLENTTDPTPFIEQCNRQKINAIELLPGKEIEL